MVRSAHDGIMTLEAAGAIQVSTIRETTCISDRCADTGTAARLTINGEGCTTGFCSAADCSVAELLSALTDVAPRAYAAGIVAGATTRHSFTSPDVER